MGSEVTDRIVCSDGDVGTQKFVIVIDPAQLFICI